MSCYPRVNSDCAIANRDLNGLGITLPPPPPLLTQQQVSQPAQQWQMPAPHSTATTTTVEKKDVFHELVIGFSALWDQKLV
ncbi:hypothetical protein Pelo_18045 [Pelomyxa schiedti]|nr:hypothetical protein Pelo_18045 [Pelomyxa schiedti]